MWQWQRARSRRLCPPHARKQMGLWRTLIWHRAEMINIPESSRIVPAPTSLIIYILHHHHHTLVAVSKLTLMMWVTTPVTYTDMFASLQSVRLYWTTTNSGFKLVSSALIHFWFCLAVTTMEIAMSWFHFSFWLISVAFRPHLRLHTVTTKRLRV